MKPSRAPRVRSYDDDDLLDTDLVTSIYTIPTPPHPPSSYTSTRHELHTRAWRGLQALGFRDIPQTIAKQGVARVVLGLNWVESNPHPKNKGGILRKLLDSGDPIPPPLQGNNSLSGKYRDKVQH